MSETLKRELILSPDNIPVLSKTNAATFHKSVKERIYESGSDGFEYVELVKFFVELNKQINGDKASRIEPDIEFIDYIRDAIGRRGNGGDKAEFKTERGVKFTLAEVGTNYDFSNCGDPVLLDLEEKARQANEDLKARKEMLKHAPYSGMSIVTPDGEVAVAYPPAKTSKSSFKISLPK